MNPPDQTARLEAEVRLPRHLVPEQPLFRRDRAAATAERARALDGRVFQHRITGELRGASWHEHGVDFYDPRTRKLTRRPHHKALQWCANADDVTPQVNAPAPLPPEVPALPVAEEAIGGAR